MVKILQHSTHLCLRFRVNSYHHHGHNKLPFRLLHASYGRWKCHMGVLENIGGAALPVNVYSFRMSPTFCYWQGGCIVQWTNCGIQFCYLINEQCSAVCVSICWQLAFLRVDRDLYTGPWFLGITLVNQSNCSFNCGQGALLQTLPNMPGKVWDEITYPSLNFNGCTVEV